jgi:hypothetical protein
MGPFMDKNKWNQNTEYPVRRNWIMLLALKILLENPIDA